MIRTVNCCDQCGAECPYESIYAAVVVQTRPDGQEPCSEAVDLCPIHMRMLMDRMVQAMPPEQVAEWVRVARTKQKPVRV